MEHRLLFQTSALSGKTLPRASFSTYYVQEKPTIREINPKGIEFRLMQSDVLDRFKKEKVGLTVESQYDPDARLERAESWC